MERHPDIRHGNFLVETLKQEAINYGDHANRRIIDSCNAICVELFGSSYKPLADSHSSLHDSHKGHAGGNDEDYSQAPPDWD